MKKLIFYALSSAIMLTFYGCSLFENEDGNIVSIGDITTSTTWYSDKVYIIDQNVYIDNATLTIEPGTVIKFKSDVCIYVGYSQNASIIANGTADKKILFTSQSASASAGAWGSIIFCSNTLQNTSMKYCVIENGGKSDAAIVFRNSKGTLENCEIKNTAGYGISAEQGFVSFENNVFSNIGKHAIITESEYVKSIGSGNQYSLKENFGIEINGGTLETNSTWNNCGVPYYITSSIDIEASLTIKKGSILKFNANTKLDVGYSKSATFTAIGTLEEPIVFTSSANSPAEGAWVGLVFYNNTLTNSTLQYCKISYGGSDRDAIHINEETKLTINNCEISYSKHGGIYSVLGFVAFNNNKIHSIKSHAIKTYITGATTINNNNEFTTPDFKGIEIAGGTLESPGTLLSHNVPYYITENIDIESTLTIAAGSILKFDASKNLEVGYSKNATIVTQGTSTNMITFTSSASTPSAGSWGGIVFYDQTILNTLLQYCIVEYGGKAFGNDGMIVLKNGTSIIIKNSIIRYCSRYGIYVSAEANLTQSDNVFEQCNAGNIYYEQE